jgi:hypothetical protein
VNWLGGPGGHLVGDRHGFRADVEPFTYRKSSTAVALSARAYSRPWAADPNAKRLSHVIVRPLDG